MGNNIVYPEDFFKSSQTVIEKAQEFKGWFEQNLEELKEVEHLNLCQEALSYLPPEIWRLPNLHMLDLKDNQLAKLPEEEIKNSELLMFNLSGNKFEVPLEMGKHKRERQDEIFRLPLSFDKYPRFLTLQQKMRNS